MLQGVYACKQTKDNPKVFKDHGCCMANGYLCRSTPPLPAKRGHRCCLTLGTGRFIEDQGFSRPFYIPLKLGRTLSPFSAAASPLPSPLLPRSQPCRALRFFLRIQTGVTQYNEAMQGIRAEPQMWIFRVWPPTPLRPAAWSFRSSERRGRVEQKSRTLL